MSPLLTRLKALHAWANHGWPTLWLQGATGLLMVFGVICVLQIESDPFAFGGLFAFVQHFIPPAHLPAIGWSSVATAVLLGLVTLPAQRKQLARLRRDRAMLQRQDWRK